MATIQTISMLMPYKLGSVNCYLVGGHSGFYLIDTGSPNQRIELEQELDKSGCRPGYLRMIVITHGDFDHIGNATHLRHTFGAPIGMHKDDSGMAEKGDMFFNRKQPNFIVRKLISTLSGFGENERFTPDLYLEDGHDFSDQGFDAKALSIPGHSKGSIGILMANGDFFCGDLFENRNKPALNSIMDDLGAAEASVEKLKKHDVGVVYPGHGRPFPFRQFVSTRLPFIHPRLEMRFRFIFHGI